MPSPTRETADRWNRESRGFRFNYAAGGPTLDMDNIYGRVRFARGEAGLHELFRRLELPLRRISPGASQNKEGESCSMQVPHEALQPAPDYPDYAQPDFTVLFGAPVHLTVYSDWVSILVTGSHGFSWDVFEEDFRNALLLEEIFALRGIRLIID